MGQGGIGDLGGLGDASAPGDKSPRGGKLGVKMDIVSIEKI